MVKNQPAKAGDEMQETQFNPGVGTKDMATHSNILAWRLPWTEKPGGLQSMGSQR